MTPEERERLKKIKSSYPGDFVLPDDRDWLIDLAEREAKRADEHLATIAKLHIAHHKVVAEERDKAQAACAAMRETLKAFEVGAHFHESTGRPFNPKMCPGCVSEKLLRDFDAGHALLERLEKLEAVAEAAKELQRLVPTSQYATTLKALTALERS